MPRLSLVLLLVISNAALSIFAQSEDAIDAPLNVDSINENVEFTTLTPTSLIREIFNGTAIEDLFANLTNLLSSDDNSTSAFNVTQIETFLNQTLQTFIVQIVSREGNCSANQREAVTNCSQEINSLFAIIYNQTQQLSAVASPGELLVNITAFSPESLNQTVNAWFDLCATRPRYQQCAAAAIGESTCQPTEYRVISAVLQVFCTQEFFDFITQEQDYQCMSIAVHTPETAKCLSKFDSNAISVDFTKLILSGGGSVPGAACGTIDAVFDCLREPAYQCGTSMITIAEDLVSHIINAVFGETCEFEEQCEKERRLATPGGRLAPPGAFVPQCKSNGQYENKQCHGSTGYCWCVNEKTGVELPMTKTPPGIKFTCEGDFAALWSAQNCTPADMIETSDCTTWLRPGFEEFHNISTRFMGGNEITQNDIQDTVTAFQDTCVSYKKFDACVSHIIEASSCRPYVQQVLSAVFDTVCSKQFVGLLLTEAPCLGNLSNSPQTRQCQSEIQQTVVELQQLNLWQGLQFPTICLQVQSSLGCLKESVVDGQCGVNIVNSLDKLAKDTVRALFGTSCTN